MKTKKPVGPYMESYLKKAGLPAKPQEGDVLMEADAKQRARARKKLRRVHRRQASQEARRHARFGMLPAGQRIG